MKWLEEVGRSFAPWMMLVVFTMSAADARAVVGPPTTEELNARIDREGRTAGWAATPVGVATQLFGQGSEAREFTMCVKSNGESADSARVIVVHDGLLNDSVRSMKLNAVLFKAPDGLWRVRRLEYSYRCWRGRGHLKYSPQPCK